MTGKLTFHIERDGEFSVLTYKGGGCRPVTPEEIELWEALLASTQQASTEIDELKAKLASYEREREDQNRYLAAQSAEIAGLKQRLAQQPSVEVMEKRILKLADKYRIDYGGDYSRNAKEHEIDLLAFVRAVLSASTQQLSGLSEFLRNHAIYHESGIASKAPEVVEHVKKLRAWADALDGMPQTVEQQTSGEVTPLKVKRHSDMSVLVVFSSCRQASVFEREIAARAQGGES
ncbi:hypothetical protein [Burkholderia pseudomallei]|uniref:hypothetical protein n=1 Tax=Burkholderia pseudomallei TaxID=28450 RepID=UPI0011788281|nr:hypothetical protein [Burkholderia pseudomallei]